MAPPFQKAQSLVNQATKWADQHEMTFNVCKCGYLISHSASKVPLAIRPSLRLYHQSIPHVQSYKLLGVMFYYQGIDFIAESNMLTQRVERQLGALRWFSNL